jgi:hypothetical protein
MCRRSDGGAQRADACLTAQSIQSDSNCSAQLKALVYRWLANICAVDARWQVGMQHPNSLKSFMVRICTDSEINVAVKLRAVSLGGESYVEH